MFQLKCNLLAVIVDVQKSNQFLYTFLAHSHITHTDTVTRVHKEHLHHTEIKTCNQMTLCTDAKQELVVGMCKFNVIQVQAALSLHQVQITP